MAKRKQRTTVGQDKSPTVADLRRACSDELAAVEFMERQRWGSDPACPRCGDTDVYQMQDRDGSRNTRFLWRCRGCKKQYSVRIGTVFEDSRIPMRHWCYAFWQACASKKGVSALQIKRQTGLSYKSALFMMHRIRWAMRPEPADAPKLSGIVEADETHVGGKPRKPRLPGGKHRTKKSDKAPVFAVLERGGDVRAMVIPAVRAENIKKILAETVDTSDRPA